MRKTAPTALLLIFVLASAGCATKSPPYTPPVCPQAPPLPASLTQPLNAEQSLSRLLLESEPAAMQSSED